MPNPTDLSARMLRFWASEFSQLQTERQLRELLEVEATEWVYLLESATYQEYTIPKRKGGFRLVEDPEPELKEVLRRLNQYVQAVYFTNRSAAAYGFLLCPDNDPDPRNVLTHARRHCNQPYLLNADFIDFFHAVSQERVQALFQQPPFDFSDALSNALAQLTCYRGRLPMGSPTSPVLSNFAARPLDDGLLAMAQQHGWCYTRFADDLSFSSDTYITKTHILEIRQVCLLEGFRFNEQKLVVYGPGDEKYVTGLLVSDTVDIPADYLDSLRTEIAKLQTVMEVKFRTGAYESAWVGRFKQQIEGHLRFAQFVLGPSDPDYQLLQQQFTNAQKPINDYGPASWLDFNYF